MAVTWKLLLATLKISLLSFGGVFGVLPDFEKTVVQRYQWVTHQEFVQAFAASQFVPGPNVVMFPFLGYRIAGIGGLVACFLGVYLPPLILMGLLSWSFARTRHLEFVQRTERALRPVVLGLLAASLLSFVSAEAKQLGPGLRPFYGFSVFALSWIVFLKTRVPPLLWILLAGFGGILI